MVLGIIQNYHSIPLSLAIFKYLNFITFGTKMLLENKLHRVSLKWFKLKNVTIQPEQKCFQERSGMFIVS